jgi:hypothetical protein
MKTLVKSTKGISQWKETLGKYTEDISKSITQQASGAAENFVKVNPLRSAEHKAPLELLKNVSKALSLAQNLPNPPVQSLRETKSLIDTARENVESIVKEASEQYNAGKVVSTPHVDSAKLSEPQKPTELFKDIQSPKKAEQEALLNPSGRPEKSSYVQHLQSDLRTEEMIQKIAKENDILWKKFREMEKSMEAIPQSQERDEFLQKLNAQKFEILQTDLSLKQALKDLSARQVEKIVKETSEKHQNSEKTNTNLKSTKTEQETLQQTPARPEKSSYVRRMQDIISAEQNLQKVAKMFDSMWSDIKESEQKISKMDPGKEKDQKQQSLEVQKIKMMIADNALDHEAHRLSELVKSEKLQTAGGIRKSLSSNVNPPLPPRKPKTTGHSVQGIS